jgi:hypothetical protein
MKIMPLIVLSFLILAPVWAQEAPVAPSPSPASDSNLLKGGVKGAALRTEDGLIKMGEAVQDIRQASGDMIYEVTRKNNVVVRGPNVIGPGVIIPAMPNASGMIQMGTLPARKKQMESFLNRLGYSIQMLQNEIDALIIPDDKMAEVSDSWNQIRQGMEGVQTSLAELKVLCQDPNHYDNDKIGKRALYIYDQINVINGQRKQVLKKIKS